MIKNISYELLGKAELTTDILLKFEDSKINKRQYVMIKDRLDDYNQNIGYEYSISFNTQYDNITHHLLIGLIISIHDIQYPRNVRLEQIINEQSYKFINFYEKLFNHIS